MSQNPKDLRYTKDHEWARKEGDLLRVGITLHAVGQLGDITLVDLAAPGTRLAEHARFGDIESVKAVSELFAPVAGEIVERNAALESSPEAVNADAYGEGWMVLIKPDDPAAFDALLDADAYDALLGSL
jgi:glycine cleavage system H protein